MLVLFWWLTFGALGAGLELAAILYGTEPDDPLRSRMQSSPHQYLLGYCIAATFLGPILFVTGLKCCWLAAKFRLRRWNDERLDGRDIRSIERQGYVVCPTCSAREDRGQKTCRTCDGYGCISKENA